MSKVVRRFRVEKIKERMRHKMTIPCYPSISMATEAVIADIVHSRGRGTPLTHIKGGDKKYEIISTEGNGTGDKIMIGDNVPISLGNITKLRNIPEGTPIHSIEYAENDGGKLVMAGGTHALLVNQLRETDEVMVKLPSGDKKTLSANLRCVIGIVAGGGIKEKPLLKASVAHYKAKAHGQYWPRVRGVAMNPVDHPHGGGNKQHVGKPTTVSKYGPRAQQIGLVGARRTGYRRGSKN